MDGPQRKREVPRSAVPEPDAQRDAQDGGGERRPSHTESWRSAMSEKNREALQRENAELRRQFEELKSLFNSQRPTSHAQAQQEAQPTPIAVETPRVPHMGAAGQPQQTGVPYGCTSKAPSFAQSSRVPGRMYGNEQQPTAVAGFGGAAQASVQFGYNEPRLSPAYAKADDATWEHSILLGCYRP